MYFARILFAAVLTFGLLVSMPLFGDSLSILNTAGGVQITNGNLAFYPIGGPSGDFSIQPPPATGIFSSLSGTGTIVDLNDVSEPINTVVNITDFMTFASTPTLSFTLTELLGGTFAVCDGPPPAAGQVCTVPGTPYNLTNQSATSSIASFAVLGNVVNTADGSVTPFQGTFSTQFTNMNYQQLVNDILGPNPTPLQSSYSAQFVTTPEPASVALIFPAGLGLLLLTTFGRKLRRGSLS